MTTTWIIWGFFFPLKNDNYLFLEFGKPRPWYPGLCFSQTTQHRPVGAFVFGFLHGRRPDEAIDMFFFVNKIYIGDTYCGIDLTEQVHCVLVFFSCSADTAVQEERRQNNQVFNLITPCIIKSKSRGRAVNGTYLKSNLDLSKFTWTSWLSSTQNSTKTASLLSYHRAAACCVLKKKKKKNIQREQTPSHFHSVLTWQPLKHDQITKA